MSDLKETYRRSIGANVRRYRVLRGLTQRLLATRAKISLAYEQRIERVAVNSFDVLVRLANARSPCCLK
jgi:transcriptional regulator with XRE-family HTH domain